MVHRHLGAAAAAAIAVVMGGMIAGQCGVCPAPGQAHRGTLSAQTAAATYLTITCQPNDIIELDGYTMRSTGEKRTAVWHLERGKWYRVQVRVTRNGVTHEQTVTIRGGDHNEVDLRDLTRPAAPSNDADLPRQAFTSGEQNFGLDVDKLSSSDCGPVCGTLTREDVLAYVRATDRKARVTVIAAQDAVDRIRKELQGLEDAALVQVYPPGHWALRRANLEFEPGTVVVQYPDGRLFAKEQYKGPEQVKSLLARYEAGSGGGGGIPTWVWIVGLIVLVLMLRRK